MIRRCQRKENFSSEEKDYILRYVNENRKILEDKSNAVNVYLKKQDKWRNLAEHLKVFGVVRDWKEIRGAYQRWKVFAKKNIAAFRKRGYSIPTSLSPTEFDYIIYNISPQDFEDNENNLPNEYNTSQFTGENDELSNMSHSFIGTNGSSELCHNIGQFIEEPMEQTDEIFDESKIKLEPQINKENVTDSSNACEETRNNTHCVQNIIIPTSSTNIADSSGELSSSNIIEPAHKKQRIYSSNDHEFDNVSNNVDNEFKRQENTLKLAILRAQLNREEEESKIRIEQERIKLNILKLQLKKEKLLLKNILNSS